jgi:type I restriction enzyme R subunit
MLKPERLKSVAEDIADHFTKHVEPNGYKAQVVCFTRWVCVRIKEHLDKLLGAEVSDIIYTGAQNDEDEMRKYHYSSEEQKTIVSNFKNPDNPLKILLVQSMLLTGFDAPVEQVMYLDRPLRDHNLLQAIARTNRPYLNKQCGIIVDYCGVLKHLDKALNFNEEEIESCLIDFDELKNKLPDLIDEFKNIFAGVNITNLWHCLKHIEKNKLESHVNRVYKELQLTLETIAPDPFVLEFHKDYKWATEIIVALRQLNANTAPNVQDYLAHTRELIQEHIDIGKINTTAPVFVVDDNYLRRIDELPGDKEQREILLEKRLRSLLTIRLNNLPIYKTLMERLKKIVEQKDQETQDTLALLIKLTGDLNEAVKQEEAMGLSKGEMAIRQLVSKKVVQYGEADELVSKITQCVAEETFPGWQAQSSVHATIKKDIILELAKYTKEHPDVKLSPDDYSKFSHERAKHINISVKPFNGVRVAVPYGVSFNKAKQVAQSKKSWIKKHLNKMKQVENEHEEFIKNSIEINRTEARKNLVNRLNELSAQHGFSYNKVFMRNQKTRWGSCSAKNNINLNMKLVRLPDEMIDYVLLHELVHTRIKNHANGFWAELNRFVEDAKAKSKKLNEYKVFLM